jgi:hypothetical protein
MDYELEYARRQADFAKPYKERLRDPRWQRRRLELLEKAEWACEECGATERTLEVHHTWYRKNALPWEHSDSELRVLCDQCHGVAEANRSIIGPAICGLRQDVQMALVECVLPAASNDPDYFWTVVTWMVESGEFSNVIKHYQQARNQT